MKKLTKEKREELIKKGKICPYCGRWAILINSIIVYKTHSHGLIRYCQVCKAYVAVHPKTANAMGRLANKNLRIRKRYAHYLFDNIWRSGKIHELHKEISPGASSRNKAYKWLALKLNIPLKDCHIGYFDMKTTNRVINICKAANRINN